MTNRKSCKSRQESIAALVMDALDQDASRAGPPADDNTVPDFPLNLPELPSLDNLKSISSESLEKDKDFSIDYGDGADELEELEGEEVDELEEISENDVYDEVDPVDEVFSEIGENHLINTDDSSDSVVSEGTPVKTKKKFTYASYSVPTENILNDYSDGHYWVIDDQTRLAAEVLKETL